MNYSEDIKPISYIKSNSAKVLDQINKTRRPIIVTQKGKAKGVFLDTTSYKSLIDAVNLMKLISQSESDILKGNVLTTEEVVNNIDALLKDVK